MNYQKYLFLLILLISIYFVFFGFQFPPNFDTHQDMTVHYDELPDDTIDEVQIQDIQLNDIEEFRVYSNGDGEGVDTINIDPVDTDTIRGRPGRRGRRRPWRRRPWRRWPFRLRRRFYRPWIWRSYPNYIYTYPYAYYTQTYTPPAVRYIIRLREKSSSHPFYNQGFDKGFTVNGVSGARLELRRGQTYEFDISTLKDSDTGKPENEPFIFTYNASGGSTKDEVFQTISPTSNGTIRLRIPEDFPQRPSNQSFDFYYMSTNHEYVGGYVIIN